MGLSGRCVLPTGHAGQHRLNRDTPERAGASPGPAAAPTAPRRVQVASGKDATRLAMQAVSAATSILRHRHPAEFHEILREQRVQRGLSPESIGNRSKASLAREVEQLRAQLKQAGIDPDAKPP